MLGTVQFAQLAPLEGFGQPSLAAWKRPWERRCRCLICCRTPFHETNEVKGRSASPAEVEAAQSVEVEVALLITQKSVVVLGLCSNWLSDHSDRIPYKNETERLESLKRSNQYLHCSHLFSSCSTTY